MNSVESVLVRVLDCTGRHTGAELQEAMVLQVLHSKTNLRRHKENPDLFNALGAGSAIFVREIPNKIRRPYVFLHPELEQRKLCTMVRSIPLMP